MFSGAMTAIVTPFRDGAVDEETLRRLIEFQIENGITGIVPCGTTGESPTLSYDEHKQVVKITVEQVNKRVPVIAGAGSNSTREAIEMTAHAKAVGADAALHITPYYNKPTQEGIYQHFAAIAKETGLPLVAYNIQGRTGVNIEPATMARMAEMPELVAVKEASGNLAQMSHIYNLCGDKLTMLSGDDGLTLPLLAIGGKGVISVVTNLAPRRMVDLVAAWQAGKPAEATRLANQLFPLCAAMFMETNPIPIKVAMALAGILPNAEFRLPMCAMNPANQKKLEGVLKDQGLI